MYSRGGSSSKSEKNSPDEISPNDASFQYEGFSATPYREEPPGAFDPDAGNNVEYAMDYFKAVQAETAASNIPFITNNTNQQWSDGLLDEENEIGVASFAELDQDWDEGLIPPDNTDYGLD